MRVLSVVSGAVGSLAALAGGFAAAATIVVGFPEFNGPSVPAGPYPQPPLTIATRTFTIPPGERVVAASISGQWGSSVDPDSTAGVQVVLDGAIVEQCVKPSPQCWTGSVGPRPWSHTLTPSEMALLNDGSATLTAVQTSDTSIQLGVTTLVIETAPPPGVPTLSPLGLAALLAAMAAAGALAVRRFPRRG